MLRNIRSRNSARDWASLAASLGLLLIGPKVRNAVGNRIKDRVDDLTDVISDKYGDVSNSVAGKYENAVDRLEAATDALRGRTFWASRATGFLLGIGVGAGLGILLAPTSGRETRDTVRAKATEMSHKIRESISSMPSTGTEG